MGRYEHGLIVLALVCYGTLALGAFAVWGKKFHSRLEARQCVRRSAKGMVAGSAGKRTTGLAKPIAGPSSRERAARFRHHTKGDSNG